MFVVQVVVAIGIVLATVLVAGGRGDGLTPIEVDRARPRLPADRHLVADDVEAVRLGVAFRGYRMDEVDELMDRVVLELAERDERILELERMRRVAAAIPAAHRVSSTAGTDLPDERMPPVVEPEQPTTDQAGPTRQRTAADG